MRVFWPRRLTLTQTGDEMTYGTYFALPVSNVEQTVDTIAALAASDYGLRPINTIFVKGYAAAGDAGAAVYKKVGSQPSHAGKVQSADGQWWELTTTQPNAYMFGAVGNGSTDDATALQNLFDYADATTGIAYLTAGSYAVQTASLTVPSNVEVRGIGPDSAIIRTRDVAIPVFGITSKTNVQLRDFAIAKTIQLTSDTSNTVGTGSKTFTVSENASTGVFPYGPGDFISVKPSPGTLPQGSAANFLLGQVTSYTGTTLVVNVTGSSGSGTFSSWVFVPWSNNAAGVILTDCNSCVLDNLFVSGGAFYIGLETLRGTNDVIKNCFVTGVFNRGLYIYAFSGTSRGCRLQNNTVTGNSLTDYLINCNGSTNGYIESATITGNFLAIGLFDGIVVGGRMWYCTVSGNTIDNILGIQGGVYIGIGILVEFANTYTAFGNTVTGNMVRAGLNAGIYALSSANTTVTGNTVYAGGVGIQVNQTGAEAVSYTTVTGNNVSYATNGISLAGGAGLTFGHAVTGNVVSNCTVGFSGGANVTDTAIVGNVFSGNSTNFSNSSSGVAASNVT